MTTPEPEEGRNLTAEELAVGAEKRWEQGPVEILVPPDDSAPPLPPEVWQNPPEGYVLPE